MGRKLRQNEHNASIYFKLDDESTWLLIDKLMTLPQYEKSRNSLINRALDYGLPKLIEEEFGEIKIEETDFKENVNPGEVLRGLKGDIKEIVYLLRRIELYTFLTKSMCCSIFNGMLEELGGRYPEKEKFGAGKLDGTPQYLSQKEIDMLVKMREERNGK